MAEKGILAETGFFGFSPNFSFSQGPCFGFGISAKNLFRLPTTEISSESVSTLLCTGILPVQGSSSGRGQPFVDFKLEVAF